MEVIRRARGSMGAARCLSLAPNPHLFSLFSTLPLTFPHSFPLSRPLFLSLALYCINSCAKVFFVLLLLCQESVLDMEIQAGQREEIKRKICSIVSALALGQHRARNVKHVSHKHMQTNTC